jgi:hypothetical protein
VFPHEPALNATAGFLDENQTRLYFAGRVDGDGYAEGNYWVSQGGQGAASSPLADGFLYGPLDANGSVSGRAAFVFPDMRTALVGDFIDGVMKAAQEATVVAERCFGGIKEVRFSQPKSHASVYFFERPTHLRFGGSPVLADPYERRMVYVKDVQDGRGDGLYVKRDVKAGQVLAYYAGMIFDTKKNPIYHDNQTDDEM